MKNSELLSKLDLDVTHKFDQKNILYWNYFPDESKKTYLSWQKIFDTEDRKVSQWDKHYGEQTPRSNPAARNAWHPFTAFHGVAVEPSQFKAARLFEKSC